MEATPQTQTRPNEATTLKEVLGAVAHLLENDQVKHGAPALVNILNSVQGYDSDHMATFRQIILGFMHHDRMNYPAQAELYELWEEDEKAGEYKDINGEPLGFVPPFADAGPYVPSTEPVEIYHDVVLHESQMRFLAGVLDTWKAAKGESITQEEQREMEKLLESIYC